MDRDEESMRLAVAKTREGIRRGQAPFGACIVDREGRVIACAHNLVWKATDITAHGEVTAIRLACRKLGSIDLSGCAIYSTCEPCPMCFSAIHWAGIGRIVYGSSIADAEKCGFSELAISSARMRRMAKSRMRIRGGVLAAECRKLFGEFLAFSGKRRLY